MGKKPPAVRLGEIMSGGLPWRVAARLPGPELLDAWRQAAGPAAAARAWPVCLEENGRLVVAVRGSLWRQELILLLPGLLAALQTAGQPVGEIRLVNACTPLAPPPPPPPEPELTPEEERLASRGLEAVGDPGLRASLVSLRQAQLRAEKGPSGPGR